jgi:hypothetical protein
MSTLRITTLATQDGTYSVPSETLSRAACRAWVNFNGTGTVAIRASYNVSSITDNGGSGSYTVNFTNAMVDANYAAVCSAEATAGAAQRFASCVSNTTTSVVALTAGISGGAYTAQDSIGVFVAIFR